MTTIHPAISPSDDDDRTIPDDDREWTQRMIARERDWLDHASPTAHRYHELRLAGWYRHLEYAERDTNG